jgi:hypothetical protein
MRMIEGTRVLSRSPGEDQDKCDSYENDWREYREWKWKIRRDRRSLSPTRACPTLYNYR